MVYGFYLYIIIVYIREILMCCISTIEERAEERVITHKLQGRNMAGWSIESIYIPHPINLR
jgi:hypothetical protein